MTRTATDPDAIAYRLRVLPERLRRSRARTQQLEAEARRYRMFDLLEGSTT